MSRHVERNWTPPAPADLAPARQREAGEVGQVGQAGHADVTVAQPWCTGRGGVRGHTLREGGLLCRPGKFSIASRGGKSVWSSRAGRAAGRR